MGAVEPGDEPKGDKASTLLLEGICREVKGPEWG